MESSKKVQEVESFKKEEGWTQWLFNTVVKKPILNWVPLGIITYNFCNVVVKKAPQKRYVHLQLVKEYAEKLLSAHKEKKLVLFEDLIQSESEVSREDIELCISYLSKNRQACVFESPNGTKVPFLFFLIDFLRQSNLLNLWMK